MAFTYRRALILVSLSAILSSLSFVPYNIFPLGFIGFVPLFLVFENFKPTKKQIWVLWALWTLILNLIGYHWIMHTIAVYGMMPHWVAFPLFLLYTFGFGSKMLLLFFFLRWMYNRTDLFGSERKKSLSVVAAFAACELLGWQLFPWHGGNLVSGDLWFAQAADTIGTRGLSAIWILLQYLFYLSYKEYRAKKPLRNLLQFRPLQISLGILLAIHLYGFIQVTRFTENESKAPKIIVGVPQGSVPLITSYHERPYIISRMIMQTQRLIADATVSGSRPDLIVWPESSIPASEFERTEALKSAIINLQKSTQIPIIINDILHENGTNHDYSNMWHLDRDGNPVNNYQKNFLLPFGEFMPLGETFPALKNMFPAVSDFSHGQKFSLFNISSAVGAAKAMPLICYEVILPEYARDFDAKTNSEAQFMINITNDAWFGESVESLQHMTLGVMRAIELRLPIVRSTNSGISAYVSSTGALVGETKLFERVNQIYRVPLMPRTKTLFAFWGNLPLYFFMIMVVAYIWLRRKLI